MTGINCQNNYCIYFVVRRNHVHLINIFSSDMDNRNILVYSRPHGKDVDRVMFRFHADMKWKCEIVAKILTFVFVLGNKTKCHLKGRWLPPPLPKKKNKKKIDDCLHWRTFTYKSYGSLWQLRGTYVWRRRKPVIMWKNGQFFEIFWEVIGNFN